MGIGEPTPPLKYMLQEKLQFNFQIELNENYAK